MLEIKHISKNFNSKSVLNDISFDVNKGRIFGIIGPNGAGKTTTLRIILGILSASSGEVLFENRAPDKVFFNLTGYLPEERGLYPKSNIFNTLVYFAQLKGLTYSRAVENVDYWLSRLELSDYKKYKTEELSKGNQQKVQFISAIVHDPEIMILDEPFSGFDPVNQTIFRDIIEEKKKDKYVILSTHLMDLAESLCDEIILIDKGSQIISGNINEILSNAGSREFFISFNKMPEMKYLEEFEIKNIDKKGLRIKSEINDPALILNKISKVGEVKEFSEIKPTLHQLFLTLVKKVQ